MAGVFVFLSQVEQFLLNNAVDGNAADSLRNAAPEVQEACLRRGDLLGVRNASAALLSRLRDPGNGPRGTRRGGGGGAGSVPREESVPVLDDVEEFLRHYGVDSMACEAFRKCRRDVQEAVIEKGLAGLPVGS